MTGPTATTRLHWLPAEQGGRQTLPIGPEYATIAHFRDEAIGDSFSVIFRFEAGSAQARMNADLRLLAPDRLPDVVKRIVPGARLIVTEGPRTVAECEVTD